MPDVSRTPRAWLVNPFDPVPDSSHRPMRYEGFANALVDAGWEVVWFTADFDHLTRRFRVPPTLDRTVVQPRLRIEYVHVPPYQATFGLPRIVSHRRYTRGLRPRMRALAAEGPDVILVSLPLLDAVRASLEHRVRSGCAVVADVQDVWPEAMASALPALLRGPYEPLRERLVRQERRTIHACDGVIAVSDTYLRGRSVPPMPVLRAYLGLDLEGFDAALRAAGVDLATRATAPDGALTVLWTGTIRPAADLDAVVRAAALVRRRGVRARFLVAGDGPSRPALEALAQRLELGPDTIRFLGAYPESARVEIAMQSHVGLNAYARGCANSITNKLFDYQAAGLAIVNSIPGEVAGLVTTHAMGRNYAAGDPESLAAVITELVAAPATTAAMGRAARRFVEAHGSRAAIATRVARFLDLVRPRPAAARAS